MEGGGWRVVGVGCWVEGGGWRVEGGGKHSCLEFGVVLSVPQLMEDERRLHLSRLGASAAKNFWQGDV